jgi:hypothetical protein
LKRLPFLSTVLGAHLVLANFRQLQGRAKSWLLACLLEGFVANMDNSPNSSPRADSAEGGFVRSINKTKPGFESPKFFRRANSSRSLMELAVTEKIHEGALAITYLIFRIDFSSIGVARPDYEETL